MPKHPRTPPFTARKAATMPATPPRRAPARKLRDAQRLAGPMTAKSRPRRGPAAGTARRLTLPGKGRGR